MFPIVGIGASAGGLEAFSELLRYLPEKTGMAFVLVQHLDPKHGSALPEILARTTKIPVTEVTQGVVVQPDHAYVIPANTSLTIKNGMLQLGSRVLTARAAHADRQFLSLAGGKFRATGDRRHLVGHSFRRHRGLPRHQGGRRHHVCAG